ncbi:hypothetical protein HPB51_026383 [Rhipicephalus microplus]|uniref:Uncharacterized protein n=1 Tax=Rhipicephalus microplus TaxID=6941 RepID=A0A9J6D3B3_RHIMP|nr:hypothetical protein HPB51_026383 [Rhipicephalus microplus]
MATPNQVTGYDPESLQIIQMDAAQTETPLPTEEEYLKDMLRVWHGKKKAAVASRDARAPAAKQQAASLPQQAQGKNAPSVTSQRAKQLQWRPKNMPRIEKDDIIVVLKPRETLDLKATFGPGQAGAAVRSILGADASVGLAVWPLWDQNVLVYTLKSVDAAERLLRDIRLPVGGHQLTFRGHPKLSGEFCRGVVHVSQDETSEIVKSKLSAEPNVVSVRKLGDTPVAVITFAGTKCAIELILARARSPAAAEAAAFRYLLLLLTAPRNTSAFRAASSAAVAIRLELPVVLDGSGSRSSRDPHTDPSRGQRGGGHKQDPTPKTGPKKARATKSNKPELKKTNTGHSTNVKSGTSSEPSVLVKDVSPLTPVQEQQQIGELRRQNQTLARKIQELEAKQVGSSEPVQGAEAEDGDDGSSVTSRLTSVSRQDADTVVGPASITGSIGRIDSLERKTEQLEASVTALPTQIMSAVRESFQDMFTAALMQALPEIVAQVFNSVLKAVQPWVIAQIKNTTQSDSPQVKRKPTSHQAAEKGFSGPAAGPDWSSAPYINT